MSGSELQLSDYAIGWICALDTELVAAMEMLDDEHDSLPVESADENSYTFGRIGQHNVVIACLYLGRPGTTSAATVVRDMMRSFQSLKFVLMVGIGGGVPSEERDIRLGDVVVSLPDKQYAGVVQYDMGKAEAGGVFTRKGDLNPPPQVLLAALSTLSANYTRGKAQISEHLLMVGRLPEFTHQGSENDLLYRASYIHAGGSTCHGCSKAQVINRQVRNGTGVVIHYGTIASGNQVMKDGVARDRLSMELGGILCFEMEAAGLMSSFPCLVIRGISDYADSHKNNRWQPYAAATAAAYSKELLRTISPHQVSTPRTAVKAETVYYRYPSFKVYHFVERKEPIEKIREFHRQGNGKSVASVVVVLLGMGGCGKTQLALEYCENGQACGRFNAIFWVDASSPATVAQGYTTIAQEVSRGKMNTADEDANVHYCLEFLSKRTTPWLLVFDNFDSPILFNRRNIKEYFPRGGQGRILITSRHAASRGLGHCIEISSMSDYEGLELLFERSKCERSEDNTVEGKKIVQRLGNLALAIDQAGAYILSRNLDLGLYISVYSDRSEKLLREIPDLWDYRRKLSGLESERSLSAFTTWELSLEQIAGNEEEREAKGGFLTLAAFFDGKEISEDLFQDYRDFENAAWMAAVSKDGVWDKYEFHDVLTELRNLSLLQSLEVKASGASFSLHPLVQDWIKLRVDSDTRQRSAMDAIRVLSKYIGGQDLHTLTFPQRQTIVSHLEIVLQNGNRIFSSENRLGDSALSEAAVYFASFFQEQGRFAEAEELFRRGLKGQEKQLGGDHPDTLKTIKNLAIVCTEQGKYEKAEELHRRALKGQEKQLGRDHPNTLRTVKNLAIVCADQGRFQEAEELYNCALDGQDKKLGRDHPDTLRTIKNLAILYRNQSRYKEAEELYKRALEGQEKQLGGDHPDTLRTIKNLAIVYVDQGRQREAKELFERVLGVRERLLGSDHPDTLRIVADLANL